MKNEMNEQETERRGTSALTRLLGTREIKFRAWDVGLQEMVPLEWDAIIDDWHDYQHLQEYYEEGQLMQFIGVKDDNGDEVYEGDIIRLFHKYDLPEDYDYAVVVWGGELYPAWTLKPEPLTESNIFSYLQNAREARYFEVAGNIFENPKLIDECT